MHSEGIQIDAPTKLLIVCLQSDQKQVCSIVSRCAPLDWSCAGEIRVLPVRDRFYDRSGVISHRRTESRAEAIRQIEELAPSSGAARVLIERTSDVEYP